MCKVFSCVMFAMTSALSWQNSISLCPASFCTPRPNLPVTPGVSWLPTFVFQSPITKRTKSLNRHLKQTDPHTCSWKADSKEVLTQTLILRMGEHGGRLKPKLKMGSCAKGRALVKKKWPLNQSWASQVDASENFEPQVSLNAWALQKSPFPLVGRQIPTLPQS